MPRKLLTTLSLVALFTGSAAVVEAGWDEGVAAFKAGNYEQAAKEFQGVVEQQPEVYQGHLMLGQALLKLNRDQEALTHLRKAFELDQSNVQVQLTLGKAYLDLGRNADAGAILGKINASSLPKAQQAVLYQMLATAFEKSGDPDRAMAELAKAARVNPNDAKLQYKYGALALNAGDTGAAITALEKASQLDPKSTDIQRAYARALVKQGRETTGSSKTQVYAKAAGVAQNLASASGTYENYMLLGDARLGAKQYDQAIAAYQQAAGKNAKDWLPQYYMGQAYTVKEQYRSADAALRKALELASASKDKATIWKQLGFVYEKQKNYDQAIVAYQRAGDSRSVQRVEENRQTAEYNEQVEEQNRIIEELAAEEEKIKKELKELPGGPPPTN
jgi:tetratricopeptide (TPR) repeat protein